MAPKLARIVSFVQSVCTRPFLLLPSKKGQGTRLVFCQIFERPTQRLLISRTIKTSKKKRLINLEREITMLCCSRGSQSLQNHVAISPRYY